MLSSFSGTFNFGKSAKRIISPPPAGTNVVLDLDASVYSGSGNWLDQSGNNNDGVAVGTPTYTAGFGSYFDFTGGATTGPGTNDSFAVSDSPSLYTMTSISFEMWVRIDTVQGVGSPNLLFDKRTVLGVGYVGFFTNTAYTFRVGTTSPTQFTYSATPTIGSWQHIILTVGGSGSKMYINNSEVASSAYNGNFNNLNSGSSLYIGDIGISAVGVHSYDGEMGLFRIYNDVLTSSDVTARWNATKSRFGL